MSTDTTRPTDRHADLERLDWMLSVDERLLAYLVDRAPTRPAGIAGPLGLHLSFARTRCDRLCDHSFLEEQDGHYRLTERGRQYVERLDIG